MRKVRVDLGEKSYDIIIGYAIDRELVDFVKGAGYSRKALLVTDNNVGPLYAKQVQQLLAEAGLEAAVPMNSLPGQLNWGLTANPPSLHWAAV